MTPHSLTLTAFGPFAHPVTVDLDALAGSGLFLLHGATGAGKTTLLDGIGFALFGRVPGVRNGAKRLRSDHAAPSVATSVQLEATLGGRRLRITRSPQWERPKARGTGTTTQQAAVLLEEFRGGDWTTVSQRIGEADQEIADLVGMSAEQFFQVVLLPQGDFAQFLRASSADRVELLKRLFATERFADVESWLALRRRTCAEQLAAADDEVARVVARVAEVAGAELPDADPAAWACGLLAASRAAARSAAAAVNVATGVRVVRRLALADADRLAGLQARRRGALARQVELRRDRPGRLALQRELAAAARAAEVRPVLAMVHTRRRVRDRALLAASPPVGASWASDADAASLRMLAAAARERMGRLEGLRAVEAAGSAARRDAVAAQAEQAESLAEVAATELELAGLPARKARALDGLAATRRAALDLPGLQAERETLNRLRPDLVSVVSLHERLERLQSELLSARETAVTLEGKALDLRIASVNSMIAVLSLRLEPGVPCDVCGSAVHPDPSRLRHEGVSSEDEEHARRTADDAQQHVAKLQAELGHTVGRSEELAGRVGSWTLTRLDSALAELDLQLDVLTATTELTPGQERELADLDALVADLGLRQVGAATRADAAARRAHEAQARAASAADQLHEALGHGRTVDAALHRLEIEVSLAEAGAAALEALASAQLELDVAVQDAVHTCHAAGFASVADADAADRDAGWCAAAAVSLRSSADLEAAVTAELADPDLDVPMEPPAPVPSCAAALDDADAALADLLAARGTTEQRLGSLERLVPLLGHELSALEPLEQAASLSRTLADLCGGSGANGLKMTLTSFVLAARLEEVAAAASVRLLRMTQGRYSLIHTDGAARGGSRSGLGLLARDGWSGHDRDTSTLSGGETFLAALALALGLADVVSAEAGGSRIGALFVDEGFGTLDEDSLDEVMDVLDALREGGRVVGVVSHVTELRQRIPAQVEVRRTRSGSDVLLHGC